VTSYSGENPGTNTYEYKGDFYDNCTYEIIGDTLVLSYTQYPADRPIPGEKKYVRVN
jgi:hypothetical protein